jgi:hypothetical protein
MPDLGSTYRCNLAPRHIWVIISDPNNNDGRFVFVNLTSLTENCVDDVCILQQEDYRPFLTQPTTVAYSRHKIGDVEGMEKLLNQGAFQSMPAIPAKTLQKIINGAHETLEFPKAAKSLLPPAQQV